jgi:WD40 repeat protein
MDGVRLSNEEDFFKFRRMDFSPNVQLSHFQLRNLLACASRDHILYANRSQIKDFSPRVGKDHPSPSTVVLDLSNPTFPSPHNHQGHVQISTMTVGHNVLVAGGVTGEYALVNLRAHKNTKQTEGLLTYRQNSITNHVQVQLSRGSSLPLAAFSSNDNSLRILDINTNKFIADHKYEHPINCSAISPDQRLRVIVGDALNVMICNSETGEILQELDGHRDFGFACDWADDGWTVATGNQDMQIKIWDARKWKNSSGISSPIATIAADMAGVRKLKFSPVGSGKRVLVAAEPADFVNVIDGETFLSKQTLSFFGEIGGVDFANDGQDLVVANCDSMRGGIIQYERCGLASEALYELDWDTRYKHRRHRLEPITRYQGYDWRKGDASRHPTTRGTEMNRFRKPAMLGQNMEPF